MGNLAIERESFVELVRQALTQLHDRALLQAHPLCSALSREGELLTAEALQQALLDAIRELRPTQIGAQPTSQWRRFRYLWLRYVEGVRLEEIAESLGVTDRQARRDHREALEVVAATLWTRCFGAPWLPERRGEPATPIGGDERPYQDEETVALEAELAKIDSESPHGPTSLAETLKSTLASAARLIECHDVNVEASDVENLPPAAVNRVILRQILMTLLAHVVRRYPGGVCRLGPGDDETGVTLTLSSSPAARQPAPQEDASAADAETPLGLARKLADRVGGRLVVRRDGTGREDIRLWLPAAPVTTVLIVDDNLDFLRLCRRYLEDTPYRVLPASLAAEALRVAREAQPDIIVLDVLMPTQDGWELLASLQRDDLTKHIPVVVCSVLREPSLALGLGAIGFLPKPVTLPSLLAALERAATSRRAGRGSTADIAPAPRPTAHPVE